MFRKRCLCVIAFLLGLVLFTGCGDAKKIPEGPEKIDGLKFAERVKLSYADQFAIDRYEDDCSLIYTADGSKYLILPKEKKIPENLPEEIRVIRRPVEKVYLAATAAMGLFDALDATEAVRFSGTEAENWYIESAKEAMEKGTMIYAGKYRDPDYELLLSEGCTLAVESTMIEHSPDVKEKLAELGITVFEDYSSYESHPLGRSEWIKVYGEMLGKQKEAEALFSKQAEQLAALETGEDTGKTVVFFYISNSGQAVTRKSGDYVSKMIGLAGGKNVFDDLGDENATSTVTMEMEKFYETAKEADVIIYNSTIDGEIDSVDRLIEKNSLLSDFKAVKEGNVWCTTNDLFQETMKLGTVISDFHKIFSGTAEADPPVFLYRLKDGGQE